MSRQCVEVWVIRENSKYISMIYVLPFQLPYCLRYHVFLHNQQVNISSNKFVISSAECKQSEWGMAFMWVIKFNGLSRDSRLRGPYCPYKPCNHSLYIGIFIFPHIDTHNLWATINFKKKYIKMKHKKSEGTHPLSWLVIGDGNSTSVYNDTKF